ncbi:MAG: PQQ-binding-like beta-propeller repeat protein [Sedimentisphaerales bacterium]|nr:PQQ-binding-like beta-propeller repeat protein [Sedimentisphaerales bacterium]
MKSKVMLIVIIAMITTSSTLADWPQYLGPDRNSTSPEKGLLRSWPENGPKVLWTVSVGRGFGGPVVKDGKVYLLDRDDKVGDNLRCFDLSNGKELWNFAYDAPGSVMFPGSRSVPIVEGNKVYSCGHNGDVYCIDINTHKPVWNKNVWTDFDGKPASSSSGGFGSRGAGAFPIWGITQCPLIYGDLLIVASQAPQAGVVAYEKLTGNVKWKTPNLGNESYASPSVVKIDGKEHIVMVISSTNPIGNRDLPRTLGTIAGIDPLTGKILWEYKEWECHISVPSAIDAGDNKVLVIAGYEHGAVMLEIKKQADDSYKTIELFKHNNFGDQTKPPIMHNGYFYAQFGTNRTRDGLTCMSADGKIMWKTGRSPDFNKGSMILVDGLILATDGRKTLYLIEPDPSGFKQLASAELLGEAGTDSEGIAARVGGRTQNWAPIALADGKLLIRDQTQMKCVVVR